MGLIIVFPGMSGGTVLIILGIYEKIIYDISKLRLRQHWPLVTGALVGIFAGGMIMAYLFTFYRNMTAAFLLGLLLASIKAVLKGLPGPNAMRKIIVVLGFAAGFLMAVEPLDLLDKSRNVNALLLIVGGAISSATMLIPGVPGSSVLIAMGIYDDVLFYLRELQLFPLAVFIIGCLLGIMLLSKMLAQIYDKHHITISYFFAGLIAGSSRVLFPISWDVVVVLAFLAGFVLVWNLGGKSEDIVS